MTWNLFSHDVQTLSLRLPAWGFSASPPALRCQANLVCLPPNKGWGMSLTKWPAPVPGASCGHVPSPRQPLIPDHLS
ncbi:hypothetical protein CEXT_293991 [Caerostris extrusa]|uniref:Uncharacterized protein n=1 Tax=Caerostris extrusa TaxID=172846 RepID=A0AAV4M654_CAEEX|nr:hypothetical protein CEXT_293991 [Caerostris extrusa]